MEYDFRKIEQECQEKWKKNKAYKVSNGSIRPKYYVLDMFPYPSGAGLHVGHPLGYIASDIYSRYKRLKGFNVLHPMGFDSFGLPAEQYALETGQHPAETTKKNIATFKEQLDKIGFCYDWDREVRTSDPQYYKWTQWLFLQLFNSYFCNTQQKARPITDLIKKYETQGTKNFTAGQWNNYSKKEQEDILMQRRLAFSAFGEVNWCEALGTVLANDEVVNGVSERGGHPVIKKKMRQWYMRITAYADRLLEGLETVNFSDAMKEMQRNWIGKSEGAEMQFAVDGEQLTVKVYTTRPDTIFGVDFLVLAPEHELVDKITTVEQRTAIDEYLTYVKSRSDRERMAEVKQVTGCFTGAYAKNPFDGKLIPIWIAEYVLAGYGTGAIMAVPCGDQRDFLFAKHFNIPVTNIIGGHFNGEEANATKEVVLKNSGFLNGLLMKDAISVAIDKIEELGIGKRKKNYKMRDAGFSRQRYWGEPFPIKWIDGVAVPLDKSELPLKLPHVDKYGPGPEGEGPLANIPEWKAAQYETSTMPGYAGSSWYFLRYMDPHNDVAFCDRKASDHWNQVDVYIGGTEHAVGHLLYSRMWTKVMYDLGLIGFDEPFKKLVNQGMIQGVSAFASVIGFNFGVNLMGTLNEEQKEKIQLLKRKFRDPDNIKIYISDDLMKYVRVSYNFPKNEEEKQHMDYQNKIYNFILKPVGEEMANLELSDIVKVAPFNNYYKVHVPIEYVNYNNELDHERLQKENPKFSDAEFITMKDIFICNREPEKMSKSKYNVVNPNDIIDKYGADTFRMYEMFLGPVEMSKPWDTKGIEGVHRFLRKLWRLFFDDIKGRVWNEEKATDAELKVLHRTIKKIEEDTERFSFNTAVSTFMICVNELADLKCNKKEILQPLLILLAPYAPHIAEYLYTELNLADMPHIGVAACPSILDAAYPVFDAKYLVESSKEYPISINGKVRTNIEMALDLSQQEVEKLVLANETIQKWLEGKKLKKIIYIKGKMVNVVM